mmetsp:Transcript_29431/g.93725  ORF Transcript_29431/g.93725 Transcript_29431/m.93725 type:complete len:208 (+) Transcript_29431:1230-1853(+)
MRCSRRQLYRRHPSRPSPRVRRLCGNGMRGWMHPTRSSTHGSRTRMASSRTPSRRQPRVTFRPSYRTTLCRAASFSRGLATWKWHALRTALLSEAPAWCSSARTSSNRLCWTRSTISWSRLRSTLGPTDLSLAARARTHRKCRTAPVTPWRWAPLSMGRSRSRLASSAPLWAISPTSMRPSAPSGWSTVRPSACCKRCGRIAMTAFH